MTNDDREDFRYMRWVLGLVIGLVLIGAVAAGASRLLGLAWFPWEIGVQTGMIRASNSYITTQQQALRQFRSGFEDAVTNGQRAVAVRQMREIADTIPGDVQPDIAAFLASH